MKSKLTTLLFLLQFVFGFSQEQCGFDKMQKDIFDRDPIAKQRQLDAEYQLLNMDIQRFSRRNGASTNTTVYEIPVVVHLMNDGSSPLKTDAQIQTWIDNCNRYFDATFGKPLGYTPAAGETVIPFKLVLAKRSPNCMPTTGIVQINTTATYSNYALNGVNFDKTVTAGVTEYQIRALSRWDPQVYYNIYIVKTFDAKDDKLEATILGHASYPSSCDNLYDTFIKAVAVTSSNQTVLPHEFGHAMGLLHPFEDGTTIDCPPVTAGGCEIDNDRVCDTPATKSLLGVSPLPANGSANPCDASGWNNIQFNMMNYTSKPELFSSGQKDRAMAQFLLFRENLTKSLGATAPSISPPSVITVACIPPATPTYTGNFEVGITKVVLGTINNVSNGSLLCNRNQTYYDYTTKSCLSTAFATTLLVAQNPQIITLRSTTNDGQKFSAWIDYDNNSIFEEKELIVSDKSLVKDTDTSFNFIIEPTGVTLGAPLRMRVIGDSVSSKMAPCGKRRYGEVEDYQVTIIGAHPITASAGTGGTITPAGTTYVTIGDNQTYTITPNACYQIATVLVDGVNNPAAVSSGTYSFSSVTAPHSISATFTATGITSNFAPVPAFCSGTTAPVLATTSPNGVTGTWMPATISNTTTGRYVFKPTSSCNTGQTLEVTVIPSLTSNFAPISAFCSGTTAPTLTTTAPNGVTGTWMPATISNTTTGRYVFKPTSSCNTGQTLEVIVIPSLTSNFAPIPAFCSGTTAPTLATTSPNGVTGTWMPATISNITSGTYVFTPASTCNTGQTLVVTVNTIDSTITLASGVLKANQAGASYQWYSCPNTIIPTAIGQSYTPTAKGDYKVVVTVGDCSVTSGCTTVATLGKIEFDESAFRFYPNPVDDILTISYSEELTSIKVTNILGQRLISKKLQSKTAQIDMGHLPSGTYFVEVTAGDGSKTIKVLKI